MATCRHGETESHWYYSPPSRSGEVADGVLRKWCAGALPRGSEPWRSQLEFQMTEGAKFAERLDVDIEETAADGATLWSRSGSVNATSGAAFQEYERPWREWFEKSISEKSKVYGEAWGAVQRLLTRDVISNFVPVGWFSEWGEGWYATTPIYDQLCAERGIYPAGNAATHGVERA